MKSVKFIAGGILCLACTGLVFAQARTETTVESEYLKSIEDDIISELAAAPDEEDKLLSLQYLENALNSGRMSPEIEASLESLAGEGITKQSKTKGRTMNNYPTVRRKACELLGQVKTEQSKNTLLTIATDDLEDSVVSAAVKSLADIGINNNDEVVNTITFVERKFAARTSKKTAAPSSLALEVLFAYEKLADTVQDKKPMIESIINIKSNYRYNPNVRAKAAELLEKLQS